MSLLPVSPFFLYFFSYRIVFLTFVWWIKRLQGQGGVSKSIFVFLPAFRQHITRCSEGNAEIYSFIHIFITSFYLLPFLFVSWHLFFFLSFACFWTFFFYFLLIFFFSFQVPFLYFNALQSTSYVFFISSWTPKWLVLLFCSEENYYPELRCVNIFLMQPCCFDTNNHFFLFFSFYLFLVFTRYFF